MEPNQVHHDAGSDLPAIPHSGQSGVGRRGLSLPQRLWFAFAFSPIKSIIFVSACIVLIFVVSFFSSAGRGCQLQAASHVLDLWRRLRHRYVIPFTLTSSCHHIHTSTHMYSLIRRRLRVRFLRRYQLGQDEERDCGGCQLPSGRLRIPGRTRAAGRGPQPLHRQLCAAGRPELMSDYQFAMLKRHVFWCHDMVTRECDVTAPLNTLNCTTTTFC